ncbi:MAG TPA: SpoIIE family protein phosphatase [bacterium]|nr:SpoIIE family protein phosphatase [bacterium]
MVPESTEINRERLMFLLKTLEDMGQTLTEGETFDSAARYLLRMLLGAIGISNGAIFTYVSRRNMLRLKAQTLEADCRMEEIRISPETANQMARAPQPYRIEELPSFIAEGFTDILDAWRQNEVMIVIPLAVKSDLLGMVCLGRRFMNQEYSAMDLEVLGLLTRHISLYFHSQKSLEQARSANFELRRKILEMEQLYEVGLAITGLRKPDELLQEVLVRAIAILDARYGAIWLHEDDGFKLAGTFGFSGTEAVPEIMPDLTGATPDTLSPRSEEAKCMMAPMNVRDRNLGVLSVAGKESRHGGYQEFTESDFQLLTLFASQAAVAVENANLYQAAIEKERMDRELAVAAEIQETLIPASFPSDPDLEFAAFTLPCRTVGGDFFDFFRLSDGCLGIVIADVSGKSVPAALLVSTFHGALHALCETASDLESLVSRLNRLLAKTTPANKFITALFAVWSPETGTVKTLSAGHEPAIIRRRDGRLDNLDAGGLLLGIMEDADYSSQTVTLARGEMICLYTDGVTDRINDTGERFGTERLRMKLEREGADTPQRVIQSIFRDLEEYAGDEPPPDDQTMVLIRRKS